MLRLAESDEINGLPASAIVFVGEKPCKFLEVSDRFLAVLGQNRDRVLGASFKDLFGAETAAALDSAADRVMETCQPLQLHTLPHAAGGILPLAAALRATPQIGQLELTLSETEETRREADRLVSSLFVPTCPGAASTLFVSDVQTGTIRTFHNNLTDHFELKRIFEVPEFQAITHPSDSETDEDYLERRLRMEDGEYITFDQRMRDRDGGWRPVVGRVRVFERDERGVPTKMLGLLFDASHYHVVSLALAEATNTMERVEEAERTRFGRELHDSISQLLLGARMSLQVANSLPPPELPAALREIDAMIGAVQEEVRGLSFLLHPPDLRTRGLSRAMEELCAGLRLRLRLPLTFKADPDLPRASEEIEYAFYRVTQEALINVHQHACATAVEVLLLRVGQNLELVVSDDGIGSELLEESLPNGVGTASMRARMERIGGSLEFVNGSPGLTLIARATAFEAAGRDDH